MINKMNEEPNERVNPQTTQRGFIYLLGNQEPHGLPQEAHVTTSPQLKPRWVNKIIIKDLAPLSPSLVES
jgi:hypothetical protein